MKLIAAVLMAVTAWSGSTFQPQISQLPAVVPIGGVVEYSLMTLPAGDQWQWADGACISSASFPDFAAGVGILHGACPSGNVAKPDRRGNFARGWIPANIQQVGGLSAAANTTFNEVAVPGHAFRTGMKVRITSGAHSGLALNTTYYAVVDGLVNANYMGFATTRVNALAGTKIAVSGTAAPVVSQWEDPDALGRLAQTAGASASLGVGTYQLDELVSHDHLSVRDFSFGNGNKAYSGGGGDNFGNGGARTSFTGGNETRPVNVAMGYIVRVK